MLNLSLQSMLEPGGQSDWEKWIREMTILTAINFLQKWHVYHGSHSSKQLHSQQVSYIWDDAISLSLLSDIYSSCKMAFGDKQVWAVFFELTTHYSCVRHCRRGCDCCQTQKSLSNFFYRQTWAIARGSSLFFPFPFCCFFYSSGCVTFWAWHFDE